jgi:DNA polymerase III delta prime subunit
MTINKHNLWVEAYRPTTLDNYVFQDDKQRKAFERYITDKTIPHLLLSGVQGSGKTTIAQILINQIGVDEIDVLSLNASDENSIDVMRDKIKSFITTFAIGTFKVVHLEEADYISLPGQGVLRRFMEEYNEQARFILTCNYENKISLPIKSRCHHWRFKASNKEDITEYAAKILLAEKVKFDLDLLDKYVSVGYPDIRKIVNLLQQNSHNNILEPILSDSEASDYKFELINLIEKDDWNSARTLVCKNVLSEEWEDVYRFLYENLKKSRRFSFTSAWEEGIIIIADHLYKHGVCADPEINAAAMFIRLNQVNRPDSI